MFEILSALRDLNTACTAHGTSLDWQITWDSGCGPSIKANIPITDEDSVFVDGMRALLAPSD